MNPKLKLVAVAAVGALALTACGTVDDDDCRTVYVPMFYSTTDHYYHYGSVGGRIVPANKVPAEARKVSGYKAPPAPKPAAPKPNMNKPSVPKPAAPKPAPRVKIR